MKDEEKECLLLMKVLRVCRGKSSVSVNDWHSLKSDIEKFIAGSKVDLDKITVTQVKYEIRKKIIRETDKSKRDLIGENSHLKLELERLTAENRSMRKQVDKKEHFVKGVQSMLTALYK